MPVASACWAVVPVCGGPDGIREARLSCNDALTMSDGVLNGRAALVTGATRGIGAAVARALDAAGARVALSGRDRALLDEVAAGLTHEPVVLPAELRDPNAPGRLAAAALDAFATVDILINNAAMAARVETTELTAELIDAMYAVNVRAPPLLIGAVIPTTRRAGGGSIINLSSVSGVIGTPRRSAYGATKGAIDAASARSPRSSDQTTSASTPSPRASSIPSCGPGTRRSRV